MSDVDLSIDIQAYLDALFLMVQDLKTPGRKAKGKFHILSFKIFRILAVIYQNNVLD